MNKSFDSFLNMIKYEDSTDEKKIVSENPTQDGLTVACVSRIKGYHTIHYAFIQDSNKHTLTLVADYNNTVCSKIFKGKCASKLVALVNAIFMYNNNEKLKEVCAYFKEFNIVDSAIFANTDMGEAIGKQIIHLLKCKSVSIEDPAINEIPEIPVDQLK